MSLSADHRRSWDDHGYVLLPGFVDADTVGAINDMVDRLWRRRRSLDDRYVVDVFIGTPDEQRTYLNEASRSARSQPFKLNDLFLSEQLIRQVAAGEALTPILAEVLGGTPMVCNTLNFEYGSQQDLHVDTFFMPSPTPNKMVASWIALDETNSNNGPLRYVPGSHLIPPFLFSNGSTRVVPDEMPAFLEYMDAELANRELAPIEFHAQPGDVFIWHSQLYHGGAPIREPGARRRSLVTHYFTTEDYPDHEPTQVEGGGTCLARRAAEVGHTWQPMTPSAVAGRRAREAVSGSVLERPLRRGVRTARSVVSRLRDLPARWT